MKIIDKIKQDKLTLSFEIFPPKTSAAYADVERATESIASLHPDFISVTYGAGGGTSRYTIDMAADILQKYGVDSLAHLTCVASSEEYLSDMLSKMKDRGIENILALRGDAPSDGNTSEYYKYAIDLINKIKATGDFCIGGACYPEGHPESKNKKEDIQYLKEKVDAGCDFLTTQMFFDNNILYNFLYKIRERGITVPVIAGIMPVTNANQI